MAAIRISRYRLFLSLHQFQYFSPRNLHFISSKFRPISTSIIHNTNLIFSSSTSNLFKIIAPFQFRSLINYPSSKFAVNGGRRTFATRLSESNSNRPPKETITLEGCDFEHWLVVVDNVDPQFTRDEIIDSYIKTLAQILGSEEEARMKIYSVSTRHYFAFGALISEELTIKLKELPHVRWVLPDSYMDVKNKTYAGEPFINGQAVPYDPKYHEIWVRNHEESLRSNNKNRKRQKDPNSRSRSPATASTRDSSSGNWKSSPVPRNQSPETSNSQNYTSGPSSAPNPGTRQENWMPPDDTQNMAAQSAHMQTPSHVQNHDLKQAHPTYSHNQAPPTYSYNQAPPGLSHNQATQNYSHNQAPPPYSHNQAPPPYSRNQAPPMYSHNQAPSTYSHNQAPPTYSHNQAPPTSSHNQAPSSTYSQNQAPPTYSQAFKPSGMHDHTMSWTPSPPRIGLENQAQHSSHMQNQTHPPSSTSDPYNYARHSQFQGSETSTGYRSHPPQTPISMHSSSYNNSSPSAPAYTPPRDGQSWGPASGYQSQSSPPDMLNNSSHDNIQPSAYAGVQHNGYSRGDIPHQAQNDATLNGYSSNPGQQQQYKNNYSSYNMHNSKLVTTPSAQNYQNSNVAPSAFARNIPSHPQNEQEVPSEVQQNGYYGNSPNQVQNGRDHMSQYQQYQQRNSGGVQSSSTRASPQDWNYPGTAPISHGMEIHQIRRNDTDRSVQNIKLQESAAQNAGYNGGKLLDETSMEIRQTRDYQERDNPADDYMYASK